VGAAVNQLGAAVNQVLFDAVVAEVDAGEHHLAKAALGEPAELRQYPASPRQARADRPGRRAPRQRHRQGR